MLIYMMSRAYSEKISFITFFSTFHQYFHQCSWTILPFDLPSVIIEKRAKKLKDGLWYHVCVEINSSWHIILFRSVKFVHFFYLLLLLLAVASLPALGPWAPPSRTGPLARKYLPGFPYSWSLQRFRQKLAAFIAPLHATITAQHKNSPLM